MVRAHWQTLAEPATVRGAKWPLHPMIPHTLVLKPGRVVHCVYNGYWFWGRPSVDDLWHDLRSATSEIRPDV
jgi:hypothetical protein